MTDTARAGRRTFRSRASAEDASRPSRRWLPLPRACHDSGSMVVVRPQLANCSTYSSARSL